MAEPARRTPVVDESPPVDPKAVDRAFHFHRARRRSLIEQRRSRRRARIRYWFVLVLLVTASIYLLIVIWHQLQKLFGL
jgi:hypothetical protein